MSQAWGMLYFHLLNPTILYLEKLRLKEIGNLPNVTRPGLCSDSKSSLVLLYYRCA